MGRGGVGVGWVRWGWGLGAAAAAAEAGGLAGGGSGAAASIMLRIVWLQRPQIEPAPQASATCRVERAPASMACWTVLVVTPRQRQMYISVPADLDGLARTRDIVASPFSWQRFG